MDMKGQDDALRVRTNDWRDPVSGGLGSWEKKGAAARYSLRPIGPFADCRAGFLS
jgi:hypothetical protein